MTWENALGTTGLWTLALTPLAILLLYFLKLRRKPVLVPSTMLWKRTIEDLRVNSLWQRLRNNLLLWLQVLAVLLLLLAGLRPGCEGEKLPEKRYVFLVDISASMSATDLGGRTRLEEARRQLLTMLDRMGQTGPLEQKPEAMLIAFSDTAEVIQSFTDDVQLLQRKAATIRGTDRRTDIGEALVAASGLANPGRTSSDAGDVQVAPPQPATLVIFSDGGIRQVPDFSLGNLEPEYRPVGAVEPPDNVGISAFSLGAPGGGLGQSQVFAQLFNGSATGQKVDVTLFADDRLIDSQRGVTIASRRTIGLSFDLTALLANLRGPMVLRLQIDTPDALAVDNVAHLVVQPPAPARVLVVTAGNEYLRVAFSTDDVRRHAEVEFRDPAFLDSDEYRRQSALGHWALVVLDRVVPESMPAANGLLLDGVPPDSGWTAGELQFPVQIVDIDRSHPVMNNLQLADLMIVEARALTVPSGGQSLLEATWGPVMAIAPRGSFQDLVVAFPLQSVDANGQTVVNTNWPSRLSFPLFVQNVIRWLATGGGEVSTGRIQPGDPVRLRAPAGARAAVITAPDGQMWPVAADADGTAQFSLTDRTGVYRVEWTGIEAPGQKFAVNLLDPNESTLGVRESLELGFEKVAATRDTVPARREFWRWLVLLAILVLGLEWYIYSRRVFV